MSQYIGDCVVKIPGKGNGKGEWLKVGAAFKGKNLFILLKALPLVTHEGGLIINIFPKQEEESEEEAPF